MKAGDPITIVRSDRVILCEVDARVSSARRAREFTALGMRIVPEEEGYNWLRGYHLPSDAAVSAARTTQALREEENSKSAALRGFAAMTTSFVSTNEMHASYGLPNPKNELGE